MNKSALIIVKRKNRANQHPAIRMIEGQWSKKGSNELVQLKRAVGVHAQLEWPELPRTWRGQACNMLRARLTVGLVRPHLFVQCSF